MSYNDHRDEFEQEIRKKLTKTHDLSLKELIAMDPRGSLNKTTETQFLDDRMNEPGLHNAIEIFRGLGMPESKDDYSTVRKNLETNGIPFTPSGKDIHIRDDLLSTIACRMPNDHLKNRAMYLMNLLVM